MAVDTKTLEIIESRDAALVEAHISGKLAVSDYRIFESAFERVAKQEKGIRLLLVLHDFDGWTASAMWEDLKFDIKHFNDIERVAMVGENKWEKAVTMLYKPFTRAEVRYYDRSQEAEARRWVTLA